MTEAPREDSELVYAELVSEQAGTTEPAATSAKAHRVGNTALGRGEITAMSVDSPLSFTPPPPIPEDLDNVSAVGGAIAAMVLGVWSIVGSFITPWTVVNSGLGLLLGLWGLTSRHRRLAIIGMLLCVVGLGLASIQINELIQMIFRAREAEG